MAAETNPKHEQGEQLAALIEAAGSFLEGIEPRPGSNYVPLTIPLSWLVRRDGHPIQLGYNLAKTATSKATPRAVMLDPVPEAIEVLEHNGLIRSRAEITPVTGWQGQIQLSEYTPAGLERREVRPTSHDHIYRLTVGVYDSEGRDLYDQERFIFASNKGMLTHFPMSPHGQQLLSEAAESDPTLRAQMWLTGTNPNE